MILVWIYCIVIAGLVGLYFMLFQHEKRLSLGITQQVDGLFLEFDKGVVDNRRQIFDYDTTKELLFHNQRQFFSIGKKYNDALPMLMKDCQYLGDLVHEQIMNPALIQTLEETHSTRQKLATFKSQTHTILIILTL